MRSAVAYIYQCPKCGAQYVGSTNRNLSTRAAEHAGVSVRTGLHLSQPCQSHIRDHVYMYIYICMCFFKTIFFYFSYPSGFMSNIFSV